MPWRRLSLNRFQRRLESPSLPQYDCHPIAIGSREGGNLQCSHHFHNDFLYITTIIMRPTDPEGGRMFIET